MAGLESRIARLEASHSADPVSEMSLLSLPFWSRLNDALAADDFRPLLADWELPRRLAMIFREASRGGDTVLQAYARRWREILGEFPADLSPVELLTLIRERLRGVLLDAT
jgi:hypothetical protein